MSQKRFDVKVAKITLRNNLLGILRSTPEELKRCQSILQTFADGKKTKGGDGKMEYPDKRTQFLSAKAKLEMSMRVIEYEAPAQQRHLLEGNLGIAASFPQKKPVGAKVD